MLARAIVVFVCLAGGAGAIARAQQSETVPIRTSFAGFPMQIGEWRGVQEPPFDPDVLRVLGVSDYLTRAYFRPDKAGVGLYIGYWESQREGDTIHSPLNCLPGSGWDPVSKTTIEVPNGIGDDRIAVNRYIVRKGLESQVILYWYQSHGNVVASEDLEPALPDSRFRPAEPLGRIDCPRHRACPAERRERRGGRRTDRGRVRQGNVQLAAHVFARLNRVFRYGRSSPSPLLRDCLTKCGSVNP